MATAWIILIIASLVVAIVAVFIFKAVSKPSVIRLTRNRLLARFVELFLYQENLLSLTRASGRLWISLARYLLALLLPLLAASVMIIPLLSAVFPILSKVPLSPGDSFLVEVKTDSNSISPELLGEGVISPIPPVRIPGENRTLWRCVTIAAKKHALILQSGGNHSRYPIAAGDGERWIVDQWTSSFAKVLPGIGEIENTDGGLSQIYVEYPERHFETLFFRSGWLTMLSCLSLAFSIPIAFLARITV